MNENLISENPGSITPQMLYDNLPDVSSSFELKTTPVTDWTLLTVNMPNLTEDIKQCLKSKKPGLYRTEL